MNFRDLELMVMNLKPFASMDEVWQEVKSLQAKQQKVVNNIINKQYYWVTINPKPDITLERLMFQVNKVTNLKIFRKCIFSFEQRGEDQNNIGTGLHCHILGECGAGYSHSHFCSRLRNYFTEFVGNPSTHVWIVRIPEDWIEEKIQYMRGLKWDPDKEQKILMDRIWRQNNNIEGYYSKAWHVGEISTS